MYIQKGIDVFKNKNNLAHILIIEDDLEICRLLSMFLRSKNYQVSLCHSGQQGLRDIQALQPDLVVLDIMLPELNGIEICQRCRPDYAGLILMLTACSEDNAEISALDSGADGYLHKPVRPHVLLSHVEALLRRKEQTLLQVQQTPSMNEVSTTGLTVNLQDRVVMLDGNVITLTGGEYEFLVYLLERAGTVVSRDECYMALKGIEFDGLDRAMDVRLSSLRKKIKDDIPPYQVIKTIRGKGYLYIKK